MPWTPATFADTGATDASRCPGCRRRVAPAMLFDMGGVDPSVPLPKGARYICDACKETLFRTGALTKADYLTAAGAPDDLIARHSIAAGGETP